MRKTLKLIVLLTLGLAAAAPAAAGKTLIEKALACATPSACPYFPAVYRGERDFRLAFEAAIRQAGIARPSWVPNGVAAPVEPIRVDGTTQLFTSVCEPHNCGEHRFMLLYDVAGKRMSGLYISPVQGGKASKRYFGDPGPAQREVLKKDERD